VNRMAAEYEEAQARVGEAPAGTVRRRLKLGGRRLKLGGA